MHQGLPTVSDIRVSLGHEPLRPSLRGWAGLSFLVPGAHLVALVGSHEHMPSICPVGHEVLVDSGKGPMRAHGAVNVPGATVPGVA